MTYREWVEANPEKRRRTQVAFELRKYDLTVEGYEALVAEQGGVCAICGSPVPSGREKRLSVDHDHKTGKLRGLLCGGCNRGLENFRDNPGFLRRAAEYLSSDSDRHSQTT
jgi:hypothetical protein